MEDDLVGTVDNRPDYFEGALAVTPMYSVHCTVGHSIGLYCNSSSLYTVQLRMGCRVPVQRTRL